MDLPRPDRFLKAKTPINMNRSVIFLVPLEKVKAEPLDSEFAVPSLECGQDSAILLEDSFFGVTDPVLRPPDVAFVETVGAINNYESTDISAADVQFDSNASYFNSFDDTATDSQPFQHHSSSCTLSHDVEHQNNLENELTSWLEKQTDLDSLFSNMAPLPNQTPSDIKAEIGKVQTFPPSPEKEDHPEQQQMILEEIIRECEEYENSSEGSPLGSVYSPGEERVEAEPCRGAKKRSREEARLRKREQNREAAKRYREKMRQERKGAQGELDELQQRNARLRDQVEDALYEIGYLKKLMKEINMAKTRHSLPL